MPDSAPRPFPAQRRAQRRAQCRAPRIAGLPGSLLLVATLLWAPAPSLAQADTASAEPWPQFRGGAAQRGIAVGPLPRRLTRLWLYETSGAIRATPVLARDRAYLGSGDGQLHAIDLATGERAWSVDTGASIEAPALVDGGQLFVGSTDGVLHALDLDGTPLWTAQLGAKITGSAAIAVDRSSGRRLVLVGSHAGVLQAFDIEAADGVARWSYAIDDPINGGIALVDGRAIFGACDDQLHVVSATSGAGIARVNVGDLVASTAAVDAGDAYLGTLGGEFLRVGIEDGSVRWRRRIGMLEIHSSAAVTENSVIFGSRDKSVHALDRATGLPSWSFATRGRVDGSPVVAGERLVIGSADGRLYLLATATGETIDSYELGGRISGSPAVGPGIVVVGTESGDVQAFGATP